jgi:hypothetical protein
LYARDRKMTTMLSQIQFHHSMSTLHLAILRRYHLVKSGLYFSYNMLTNTIPEEIGNFGTVKNLFMSGKRLTGTLPPSIGRLTTLIHFFVDEHSLTGLIPSSIGNWTQIGNASFERNNFTGEMPHQICANIQEGNTLLSDCNINCSCCTSCF